MAAACDDVSVVLAGEVADRFEQGHEGRDERRESRDEALSEIESEREIEAARLDHLVFDPPGPVGADEITEQAAAQAEAEATDDRFTLADECDHERLTNQCAVVERVGRVVGRSAIPGGTNIPETDNLEVADEIRLDRTVEQVTENRHAHFAVDHDE